MNSIKRTAFSLLLLGLLFSTAIAQKSKVSICVYDFQKAIAPDTFLLVPIDSIFKGNRIRKDFKACLYPLIELFAKDNNYHLSFGLYETMNHKGKNNYKKIGKLYNYFVKQINCKKYVFNSFKYKHDLTLINRAKYLTAELKGSYITFNLRRIVE